MYNSLFLFLYIKKFIKQNKKSRQPLSIAINYSREINEKYFPVQGIEMGSLYMDSA